MADSALVGEAAIRIVPILKGFKAEVESKLRSTRFEPIRIKVDPEFKEADAKLALWRKEQDAKGVQVQVRADGKQFDRDMKSIEHRVAHSPLHQLTTFNIKVIGLDALPALAYAAASAASGLDALGESVLALPGIFAGALVSVGALSLGMDGLRDAYRDYEGATKNAGVRNRQLAQDNREVERSYRDYRDAVRESQRALEDINAENRRSSLSVAEAELSVQESADRLREGNFRTITEFRRAQLGYAESIDHLQEVRTKSNRTHEDANRLNAEGVQGSDRVENALDRIAKATERLNQQQSGKFGEAFAKLSPNAQAAVVAVESLRGEFINLQHSVQDSLFAGIDKDITNLARTSLPMLQVGLSRVAAGLNTDFHQIFVSLGSKDNQNFMQRIFGNTDGGLRNMAKGVDPLITAFARLSAVSSSFLPRLGDAAAKVFDRFDKWTEKISADGSLNKWIDNGLNAMDDLGNIAKDAIGIIHQIGTAFDQVSGHQGGFLKTFADEMGKVNQHLSSVEGQAKLVSYLQMAKQEIHDIRQAWDEMKPTVQTLVGYARDWSTENMGVLSTALQLAGAFDRVTHALGPLMEFFLYIRTFQMGAGAFQQLFQMAGAPARGVATARGLWDDLGQSQYNAAKAAKAAADAQVDLGNKTTVTATKLDTASQRAKAMETNLTNFVSPARTAADGTRELGSNAERAAGQITIAGGASSTSAGKIEELKNKVNSAANSVGGSGPSLTAKLKDLWSMIGPGLMIQIAIVGTIGFLEKLGEAHRNAARDADIQKTSLQELRTAVDAVSGAVTPSAMNDALKRAQSYTVPGLGNRNTLNDVGRLPGVISPDQMKADFNPTSSTRTGDLAKLDAHTAQVIGQSEEWKRNGELWQRNGITLDVLAKAAGNDADAKRQVEDAYHRIIKSNYSLGGATYDMLPSQDMKNAVVATQQAAGALPLDVPGLLGTLSSPESASVASVIRGSSDAFSQGGRAAQQSNDLAAGQWTLKPDDAAFGNLQVERVQKDAVNGEATITLGAGVIPPGGWDAWEKGIRDSGRGDATTMPNGTVQVHLYKDETDRLLIPGHAAGGLVEGQGGPTDDANLMPVSKGEHVTKAAAVNYYGVGLFDALNNMSIPKAAGGGFPIDLPLSPPPVPTPEPPPIPGIGPGVPGRTTLPGMLLPQAAPPPPMAPPPPGPLAPPPPPPIMGGPGAGLGNAPPPLPSPTFTPPDAGGPVDPRSLLAGVDMSGNGALPDTLGKHGTIASSAPNAPVIPNANILQFLGNLARSNNLQVGSGPGDANAAGIAAADGMQTHDNDGAQHSVRRALDIGSSEQAKKGQISAFVKQWMSDPQKVASTRQLIFRGPDGDYGIINGRILQGQELQQVYGEDLGDHTDHVHLALEGVPSDILTQEGLAGLGGVGAGGMLPGGVPAGMMPGAGGIGATNPIEALQQQWQMFLSPDRMNLQMQNLQRKLDPQNMKNNLVSHYMQAYSPQAVTKFLGSQAKLGASDLLKIGSILLGDTTGLNPSRPLGLAQQGGQYWQQMLTSGAQGEPGATDANSIAGQGISDYMNNSAGLSPEMQQALAAQSSGVPGTGGGDAKSAVYKAFKEAGFDDSQWPALEHIVDNESGWDPTVSNGGGHGAPSNNKAYGIGQFLGHMGDQYGAMGAYSGDPYKEATAMMSYIRERYGDPNGAWTHWQANNSYAGGGSPNAGLAWLSSGEYKTGSAATSYYGSGLFNALNSMSIPKSAVGGFFRNGGSPFPAYADGTPNDGTWPDASPWTPDTRQSANKMNSAASDKAQYLAPITRMGPPQQPVPAATAPAASTGPQLAGPDGVVNSIGAAQPDNRGGVAAIGPAPQSLTHLNPAISTAVSSTASTLGSWGAMAAEMGIEAGSMGTAGPAAGAAGSLISSGAALAGQAVNDGLNIAASLMTPNKDPNPYGQPLTPQRDQMYASAPPTQQKVHNGDIYVSNMDEYKRTQETMDAQQSMNFLGKYW